MPAVSERDRHELFVAVQEQFGERHADTLMNLLPPVGWADVATKDDVRQLGERLGTDIQHVRKEMVELENRIDLRFEAMDEKFTGRLDAMDEKFTGRLDAMDEKFTGRLDAMDEKFTSRFEAMDEKFTSRFEAFTGRLDAIDQRTTSRFDAMDERTISRFDAVDERFAAVELRIDERTASMQESVMRAVHEALNAQSRTFAVSIVGSFLTMAALCLSAIALMA